MLQFSVDFTVLRHCAVFSCLFIDKIQTLEKNFRAYPYFILSCLFLEMLSSPHEWGDLLKVGKNLTNSVKS